MSISAISLWMPRGSQTTWGAMGVHDAGLSGALVVVVGVDVGLVSWEVVDLVVELLDGTAAGRLLVVVVVLVVLGRAGGTLSGSVTEVAPSRRI